MADLATYADVEANYRTLRGQEQVNVPTWISGASAELHVRVAGLDARIATDADYAAKVRDAVVVAVLRMLRRGPGDPAPWWYFSKDEIAELVAPSSSSGSGLPVGSFPDLVEYPVY